MPRAVLAFVLCSLAGVARARRLQGASPVANNASSLAVTHHAYVMYPGKTFKAAPLASLNAKGEARACAANGQAPPGCPPGRPDVAARPPPFAADVGGGHSLLHRGV